MTTDEYLIGLDTVIQTILIKPINRLVEKIAEFGMTKLMKGYDKLADSVSKEYDETFNK